MSFPTFDISARARARVCRGLRIPAPGLVVLLASLPLFSQANMGRILGTIRDESGAAIVGATVSVTDLDRGVTRTMTTDESGDYVAPALLPGHKKVTAEFKGFKTVEQTNILLEVGKDVRVDLTLQPGAVTQTVTVTEAPPMIETTSATLGGTISNQTLNEIPLNGRNYQNLETLRPGVTIYPGGGGWTQSTNGLRPDDNVYLVEGLTNDEPWTGMSILNGGTLAGDASTILPIDAIQEFNTEQNPRAEYGWKPGGVVNVGVKAGTNSLHGTAYAYGRTDSWDARNYFNTAPSPKLPLSLQQFGATVGGPIKKDKLFYFLGYEDQRYNVGGGFVIQAPVVCAGGAPGCGLTTPNPDLSLVDACNAVKSGGGTISPLSAQIAGLNPDCSVRPVNLTPGTSESLFPGNMGTTSPGNPASYPTGLSSDSQNDNGVVKIDYHLNDKHTLNGMYFIGQENATFNDGPNEVQPIWLTLLHIRAQTGSGAWTWTPNSRWVNELRIGYGRFTQTYNPVDHTVPASDYLINTGVTNPLYGGFPLLYIHTFPLGLFRLGASWPKYVGPDSVPQFVEHLSYQHGRHAFKFGGEILSNRHTGIITTNAKGRIDFSTLESFLTGDVKKNNGGQIFLGDPKRTVHNWQYAGFVQDDWRATPKLTLNLGVRYELDTVLKEANDLLGNFDPNVGLVQVGKQISSPYNGDHNNFAPRFGLAWDISGTGRTVLRAGGGITYEQLSQQTFMALGNLLGMGTVPTGAIIDAAGNTSGGNIVVANLHLPGSALTPGWQSNSNIFNLSGQTLNCFDTPCSTYGVQRNLRTPYVATWTLNLQHAITRNLSLDVGYVGDHGTKLIGFQDLNEPPLGSGYSPAELAFCNSTVATASSPFLCDPSDVGSGPSPFGTKFPYLGYITYLSNMQQSNYNAVQATLTQRTSHGLNFTAGYTYAHALDNTSANWGNTGVVEIPNVKLYYGNSDFDIRHRFTFTATYAIPGKKSPGQMLDGWSLNAVVALSSAMPWTIQDTTNDFTGTNEVNNSAALLENWNFFGSRSDFSSGPNPIPCWAGNGPSQIGGCATGGPGAGLSPSQTTAAPAACMSGATALGPGAVNTLNNVGCYYKGNSALIPPALGTFGNAGRNSFRDSGFKNLDISITKTWRFKERLNAQFRAEFFNIFNHPSFANPYGGPNGYANNDPSGGFGMGCGCITPDVAAENPVLGSGGNRAIQLGLKLSF